MLPSCSWAGWEGKTLLLLCQSIRKFDRSLFGHIGAVHGRSLAQWHKIVTATRQLVKIEDTLYKWRYLQQEKEPNRLDFREQRMELPE